MVDEMVGEMVDGEIVFIIFLNDMMVKVRSDDSRPWGGIQVK